MITYTDNRTLTASEFIDLLKRSTLSERRPVDSIERIEQMLKHGNLLITAWDGDKLVGVSRAMTDYGFCTYLSDLAVDEAYQRQGIGKELIRLTQVAGGDNATLILLAAPKAVNYYPKIGMEKFEHCFLIPRKNQ